MSADRLYTPWRMKYITGEKKREGCVFCNDFETNTALDRANYLIYRGAHTFTVMNIYPYNVGHLMVLPHEHVGTLVETPIAAQHEMMTISAYFTELLGRMMRPDGFNLGLNIGRAAGSGIDTHLHFHIVPRWNGDSNFLPVVGSTRILPEELVDTYDKIVAAMKVTPP